MLGIDEKATFFFIKNIYLYSLWYLAALKTLHTRGGVIVALNFPHNSIFLEALPF